MKLFILSDLHIRTQQDACYQVILDVLHSANEGDYVVFLGDVFDLFVGGKSTFLKRYSTFFDANEKATQRGVFIYYVEGNHDFQIANAFSHLKRFQVHDEAFDLNLGGRTFFFSHGDRVDQKDYGYRFLRAFFRSWPMRLFIWGMPSVVIEWIGNQSSDLSKKYHQTDKAHFERLRKLYRKYATEQFKKGYDYVVMGHCHDLDEEIVTIAGKNHQYINVGFPPVHGSYLVWEQGNERIQRKKFLTASEPDKNLSNL